MYIICESFISSTLEGCRKHVRQLNEVKGNQSSSTARTLSSKMFTVLGRTRAEWHRHWTAAFAGPSPFCWTSEPWQDLSTHFNSFNPTLAWTVNPTKIPHKPSTSQHHPIENEGVTVTVMIFMQSFHWSTLGESSQVIPLLCIVLLHLKAIMYNSLWARFLQPTKHTKPKKKQNTLWERQHPRTLRWRCYKRFCRRSAIISIASDPKCSSEVGWVGSQIAWTSHYSHHSNSSAQRGRDWQKPNLKMWVSPSPKRRLWAKPGGSFELTCAKTCGETTLSFCQQ